jgi:hypothetical protein
MLPRPVSEYTLGYPHTYTNNSHMALLNYLYTPALSPLPPSLVFVSTVIIFVLRPAVYK